MFRLLNENGNYFESKQHTSFTPIFIWVRKLDSNSLTKTKNWSGRNEVTVTSGRTPFMTTKQMTTYAANYGLQAY